MELLINSRSEAWNTVEVIDKNGFVFCLKNVDPYPIQEKVNLLKRSKMKN